MKAYGLLAALLSVSSSLASEETGIVVSHFEPLQKLTLENATPTAQQKIRQTGPVTLTFDALGRSFNLELEPNDRLLSRASRQSLPGGIALYRGRIAGKADSWTRIVVANGAPQGLIWDGEQMFAVEAPGDSAVQSTSPVIYRLADTYVVPGTMSCGASTGGGSAAAMYAKLVGELATAQASAPGATSQIDFGAIGDFEFVDRIGVGADAAIATRLNNVDGIFSEQLGVQINVETLEIHADPDDPFTDTLDSGDLLDELSAYRLDTPLQRSQGLTHLFTGRNLDTNTVGIAFLDALCSPRFGAGLSEGRRGVLNDSLIAAHEIGHNFGAPHDAEAGSACEAESEGFLMAPSLNGSDQFSPCSIAEIQPNIADAACITALPTVDMSVAIEGAASPVLFGSTVTIRFVATNSGTEQATNVELDITLPNNVSLSPDQISQVACVDGAGTVNCQLGTMAGGSFLTASLSIIATDTGTGDIVATVSSDTDDNPNNNEETVELTVDPAVDLVVNAITAAQVNLNQSTSIRADLENRSTFDATSVELSISFSGGLRADSAAWSLGSCTITAQQVDCETDNFGAQSGATLDINLTGTAAGQRTYTVSLSSTEADADSTNNSANGMVTVNAASASSSGGGGGGGAASGLFVLWLLGWALFLSRYSLTAVKRQASPARY
ncbi:MAG: M12 family metallo-peptidase [Woeseia sp.]